jgi:hypothetical protein
MEEVMLQRRPAEDGHAHLVMSAQEFIQRLPVPFKRSCLPAFEGFGAIGRFALANQGCERRERVDCTPPTRRLE